MAGDTLAHDRCKAHYELLKPNNVRRERQMYISVARRRGLFVVKSNNGA